MSIFFPSLTEVNILLLSHRAAVDHMSHKQGPKLTPATSKWQIHIKTIAWPVDFSTLAGKK